MPDTPRPYGRQPVALHGLSATVQHQLEHELRAAAQDYAVFVKAYWLRAETSGYGYPDYAHAYVWIAPVVMSFQLCEVIETLVAPMQGVIHTGRGGDPPDSKINPLRPFVYAVVDLKER
jgi:hypothetical protein